jgi:carbon-monoxide dehydrogenase small subunit
MILAAEALLSVNTDPTEHEVREAISGNICRCTGYVQIVDAILLAAKRLGRRNDAAPSDANLVWGLNS